jgi:hypothetical protein
VQAKPPGRDGFRPPAATFRLRAVHRPALRSRARA